MKYLNLSGLSYFTNKIKSAVADALDGKSDVGHTHTKSEITDFPSGLTVDTTLDGTSSNAISNSAVSNALDGKSDVGHTHSKSQITDFPSYGTTANTICEGNDSRLSDARTPTSHTHVKSEITDFPSLATVATSGSYNDLSNKPTIPTVNNATLTIQKNGTTVKTFTANASSNVTCNITVPTKVSELDNDSNYLTTVPNIDASKITSGTIDIARLPAGALERLVTVTNRTARFALTTSSVQLGDVVKQTDTGIMYYVVDTANLNSEDGYSEFTAGSATSVPWSGVTGKPSSYTPSSHTHGNITNAGAIGSTANKPLITTTNGVITTGSFGTTANTFCQGNDSRLSDARTPTAHTHSASDITSGLATVATSGSYNDLSNKPTIPTVNNATLTIQKNGTTVKTFTANQSTNATANITVPTKTSDLTNDSGFITSDNTKIPLAGSNQISGSLIPATDNSIDVGSSTKNIKMLYTKGITIDGAQFSPSDYVLPTGSYIQFAGSQAPTGFLVCNGGAISRTTYSALFDVIGTTYGSGDGSTTFNLPNLTDRFLQGSTTSGTVRDAGLPNISGNGIVRNFASSDTNDHGVAVGFDSYTGALYAPIEAYHAVPCIVVPESRIGDAGIAINASRSNSIYGNSSTVQPPALTCLICIKY